MIQIQDKKNIIEIDKTIKKNVNVEQQILGFVVYFTCFAVAIPIIFYKNGFYNFLESYLPNLDLVANILCWYSGKNGLWSDLYSPTALSIYGFLSQSFVNYLALLGVTYIIARNRKKTKNVIEAWSPALVMLLLTYLLPADFIRYSMNKVSNKFKNRSVGLLSGVVITVLIILLESFIIRKSRKSLINIGNFIINFPNRF